MGLFGFTDVLFPDREVINRIRRGYAIGAAGLTYAGWPMM